MSGDRHLVRLLRLQRMHGLLVRRQAGSLALAEAAERRALDRVARVAALLGESRAVAGRQGVAMLAGGANLRGLLAGALAAAEERAAAATGARRAEAARQQLMDIRADRIAGQVAGARRQALDRDIAQQAPTPAAAIARASDGAPNREKEQP